MPGVAEIASLGIAFLLPVPRRVVDEPAPSTGQETDPILDRLNPLIRVHSPNKPRNPAARPRPARSHSHRTIDYWAGRSGR